ncbi:MAG: prephenate dehydrogenase/arogenate dehydrogenase family protein [Firmicutes bacterium]|nr:prephenate dehydrogenase/arogenate dehydrogenase family protein [Bacillota bacterium]
MNIGIIGLGLIGGSMAKAISYNTDHTVSGYDIDNQAVRKALLIKAIEKPLETDDLSECDLIIIALYPQASIDFIEANADKISPETVVIDCGGVKECVCSRIAPIAEEKGFTFIGGHPMAGLEHSGFDNADATLFNGGSMILMASSCPIQKLETLKKLFTDIGFSHIEISSPAEHDRRIAFTSQLAHVVSNAYIKSPTAMEHDGFSAGSYLDLTRVAKLNETMWTELFLENSDNLLKEIDTLIGNLTKYRDAISQGDSDELKQLLYDGRKAKECIDGELF